MFADPDDTDEKHATFRARRRMLDGKLLAMNLRRLPFWVLSRAQYVSREGIWPDYDPIPMGPAAELAESSFPDSRIHLYTDDGRFHIERWLRTESLAEDFLRFASEFTEVSDEQRAAVLARSGERTGIRPPDRGVVHARPVQRMYERNPAWAAIEEELYGGRVELG